MRVVFAPKILLCADAVTIVFGAFATSASGPGEITCSPWEGVDLEDPGPTTPFNVLQAVGAERCGLHSTSEPRVYGPVVWSMFHLFARWFPMNPTPEATYRCWTFLKSIPAMLPDGYSGANFETILYDRGEDDGMYADSGGLTWTLNLTETCSSTVPMADGEDNESSEDVNAPTNLQAFMTYLHNRVSQNTKPQLPNFDVAQSNQFWTSVNTCTHNVVWGTFPLCKSSTLEPDANWSNVTCTEGNTSDCCQPYDETGEGPPLEPLPDTVSGIGDGGGQSEDCAGGLTLPGCACNIFQNVTYIASTGPPDGNPYSCGSMRTMDPRVFGPMVWPAIHIIALNYPHNPTEIVQYACSYFVQALPMMLPCSHCGHDLLEFLRQGSDEYAPRSVETICASRESLFGFFVAAHNNVSRHTNPLRKPVTYGDAAKMWGALHSQAVSGTGVRWVAEGGLPLCRGVGDEDCIDPIQIHG